MDTIPADDLYRITRADIEEGIRFFIDDEPHDFEDSTKFDLLIGQDRYPPKAIVGLGARRAFGRTLEPAEFSGGESSTAFRLLWSLGFEVATKPLTVSDLDATFSIARTKDSTFVLFESRGGPDRNTDYLAGLEVLLSNLAGREAALTDALVETRDTTHLAQAERRIDVGRAFPVRLAEIENLGEFRRHLTRSAAQTARNAESSGGGNPTRRLRLEIELPDHPLMMELATALSASSSDLVLSNPSFEELIKAVNARSAKYRFGELQQIRKRLKNRKQSVGGDIFRGDTVKAAESFPYAFHYGGRTELQFNIGVERRDDPNDLRHGVAFSFEPSQTLPDPEGTLVPKMRRFNEFVRLNGDSLADFRFWWWEDGIVSDDEPVRPIPPHLAKDGCFLFIGARQPREMANIDDILRDFDRLLPLYEFVEGEASFPERAESGATELKGFRPGHRQAKSGTKRITLAERELEVKFRHNELQDLLYERLLQSDAEVGTEQTGLSKDGTSIDLVVSSDDGFDYYEIKTSMSARGCLREALAQLLEYSYWPGSTEASKLIVVGESAPDEETRKYVETLRERGLPVYYESITGDRV